ncbi:hypothetical protein [Microbulbifer variabilis]|uniref:hypothetical protein n=1 Tax=Microbulbifer variabilis TaxID=266805 RepID=UPI00035FACA5|nr:hypothetical protein [Microbulbifer variabilis]
MRIFRNLKKSRQLQLTAQFPNLYDLACIEKFEDYHFLAVAVFDHWLTRGEYCEDRPSKDEDQIRFNLLMGEETELINFRFRGSGIRPYPLFREFTSDESKESYIQSRGYSSKNFRRLVLPDLGAVYFESWDYTNVFYLRDVKASIKIEEWARRVGVHCLE